MERIKRIVLGIGIAYCIYAFVLVATFVGALIYDFVNGSNEGFHWVYEMQDKNLLDIIFV